MQSLFPYALAEFGDEFLDDAWETFFLWTDAPDDIEGSEEFGTTFDPFFLYEFVPDDTEVPLPDGWPTEPAALHFLRHGLEELPELQREFIEQACKSPASFFVVEAVTAGRAIEIRDIFTGRRFRVLEESALRTLLPGHVLFTRILTAGGGSILLGGSSLAIPPWWHAPLIELRERWRPQQMLTRDDLRDFTFEIREAYHDIVDELLNPISPAVRNTDGDPLELTELTYELGIPVAEAVERLTPLATLHGDVYMSDEQHDEAGTLTGATLIWINAGNHAHEDWDNATLGVLRLDASRLVVEVNSASRRDQIEKKIATYLGSDATLVDTTVTNLATALAERRKSRSIRPPDSLAPTDLDPELREVAGEFARKFWDAWLDSQIPALGNRTPLQAATTASGRERLEVLLAEYSRTSAGSPDALHIIAIKQKLGLG